MVILTLSISSFTFWAKLNWLGVIKVALAVALFGERVFPPVPVNQVKLVPGAIM